MDNQLKAEAGTSQIKNVLMQTIRDKIFSNKELTDDQKAEQSYQFLISALSGFLANNKLQLRILMETRALEQALGKHVDEFEVTLMAKPKTAQAIEDVQNSTSTAIEASEGPTATSEPETSESTMSEPAQVQQS